jgi:hypothetical protein
MNDRASGVSEFPCYFEITGSISGILASNPARHRDLIQ